MRIAGGEPVLLAVAAARRAQRREEGWLRVKAQLASVARKAQVRARRRPRTARHTTGEKAQGVRR